MTYTLLQKLAPINSNGARPGIKLTKIDGVTIHMTDNWGNGADAIAHANYLKNGGSTELASWHYCVDDTNITQSIPDNEVAYHCGNYIGNHNTISIEICLNPESDLTKACDNAAALAAFLLCKYKLFIDNLYRHYDWSGKWCPSQMMDGKPYTWDVFKTKVRSNMRSGVAIENTNNKNNNSASIGIGSIVYFDGNSCCYSSSTGGTAGVVPPAGKYEVTHYNPGSLYSIHIGTYGWVPAMNCTINEPVKDNTSKKLGLGSTVYFDGTVHCYATSDGMGRGMIPPVGNYQVTHYNPGSKYPIHIGTYGWVSNSSCKLV